MKLKTRLLLFLLLLIINALVFINRKDFLFTKQVSYNEIYPPVSALPLKEILKKNDSTLQFTLSAPNSEATGWTVVTESGKTYSYTAMYPYILLQEGLHTYKVMQAGHRDTIISRIEYVPANGSPAFIGVYRTNAALRSSQDIPSRKTFNDPIKAEEQALVQKILKDSVGIRNDMVAETKASLIGIWLHRKIYSARGTPSAKVQSMNPYEAYTAACSGNEIWCGIYARIFNMFAQQAGLITRMIEIKQHVNNFTGAVHEFNEYFSPGKGKWLALDIMFNNVGYLNAAGNSLNGIDLKNTDYADSSVTVLKVSGDTLIKEAFNRQETFFYDLYGREKDIYIYHSPESEFNGHLLRRVRNYILPAYWYEFYSDTKIVSNRNFYIKQLLLLLLLISALYTAGAFIRHNRFK